MTEIIAHRGANKRAPQNTVPAFKKALEIGIDGFENDVHLTSDGAVVVCHNYTVNETSDGEGLIAEMTFEQLRTLDFGSYFSADFKGTKIPLLSEFYNLCAGLSTVNVEIKAPKDEAKIPELVKKTIDMAASFKLEKTLLISSFSAEVLRECKRYSPATRVALLYDDDRDAQTIVSLCVSLGCYAVHPHYRFVDEAYIKEFHAAGIAVNPWTVDEPEAIARLGGWDCDGVITDVPDTAREALGR